MADPAGVTLGVLGLAGLFSVVIEIWDFVDAGRGYSEDFSYLKTRLDNQREIFVQWGRRMEFDKGDRYNPRLDEPSIRPRIEASLNHIKLLFSNTNDLTKRYGIKIEEREVDGVVQPSGPVQIWKGSFDRFRTTLRRNQKQASAFKVTRWSLRDAKKFKTMVDRVAELMSDLNELTKNFVSQQRHEEIAREEAETIDDVAQLELVQGAISPQAGYAETIISSAASSRQRQLEQGETRTIITAISSLQFGEDESRSVSGASMDHSFHTGRTHQSQSQRGGNGPEFISDLESLLSPTNNNALATGASPSTHARSSGVNIDSAWTALIEVNAAALRAVMFIPGHGISSTPQGYVPKRILKEIKAAELFKGRSSDTESSSQSYVTWTPISKQNIFEIIGSIRGPRDTAYDGGIFHIRMNLPTDYPIAPPICWFVTKVFHPNIDVKGAICLDILKNQWGPALTLSNLLFSILSLLADLNPHDPVNQEAASFFLTDRAAYNQKVWEWTRLYATGEIIYPNSRPDGFYNTTG